jgi:tetratricopeptide (TPR) repeat protein
MTRALPTRPPVDGDELATLEAERDFLLRSLDDLEREREEGNLATPDYDRLRDEYTARAASVIRAIRDGVDARPRARPRSWRQRLVIVGGVVAVATAAAVLLGRSLGERLPGGTLSGNQQIGESRDLDRLAAAVDQQPDDPAAHRRYARALLEAGEAAEALRHYDSAAALDPGDAESRAYGGWIVFAAGLAGQALDRVDAAVAIDPRYPDARFFRGAILLRAGDDDAGVGQLERYLELAPGGRFAPDARDLLRRMGGEGASPEGASLP